MLEIKLPQEIKEYKEKLIFGLSVRQIISIGVDLGICIPMVLIGKKFISADTLAWVVIIVSLPVLACGFWKVKDMNFEEYAKHFINHNFLPQKRIYEDTDLNIFSSLQEEAIENEIKKHYEDEEEE